MINELTAIYVIIDDLLKATGHSEDGRRQLTDAVLITTVIMAARFFQSNYQSALELSPRASVDAKDVLARADAILTSHCRSSVRPASSTSVAALRKSP